ncbi:MAG: hypothetical protein RLZZ293_192 [Pseudomonadota bacterium]|jgi:CRISPR-associated protein Csm1
MNQDIITNNCYCAIKIITDELNSLIKWCGGSTDIIDKIANINSNLFNFNQDKFDQAIKRTNNLLAITSFGDYERAKPILAQVNTQKSDALLPIGLLNAKHIHPQQSTVQLTDNDKQQLAKDINIALQKIQASDYSNLNLLADHLDSLFTIVAHAVSLKQTKQISLCDLIKSKVALATALYAGDGEKLLIIQGDFYGIQDYIFTEGSKANKGAAKLLRGRSFMVSLYTELVALKVLQECNLPATAQVMNAAGKFMIVAPNTELVKNAIKTIKQEVAQWFWSNTYAVNGFGIATKETILDDLKTGEAFTQFIKSLFANLEEEKAHKFADFLVNPVHQVDYSKGVCKYNSYLAALSKENPADDKTGISELSQQQIDIGECLVKHTQIVISNSELIKNKDNNQAVIKDFLGLQVTFINRDNDTLLAKSEQILRLWDYSLANIQDGSLWNGCARRYINGYVAKITSTTLTEQETSDKYKVIGLDDRVNQYQIDTIKPWDYLACDDKCPDLNDKNQFIGQRALAVLKGDVDNLGAIFQQGITDNNFASMISLSRQINNFFAVYLPYLCATKYPNAYTVFAGGDDFFLVGSWKTIMELANTMAIEFANYTANKEVHFSAGIVMFNDRMPIKTLAEVAEHNLEQAKGSGKNAVNIFDVSCTWKEYNDLLDKSSQITNFNTQLSTSYIYGMLELCDMAAISDKDPSQAIWHSYFTYRTHRLYANNDEQKLNKVAENLALLFGENIKQYTNKFKISLTHYLYQQRI